MRLWHGHADTPRHPARPIPGEPVTLRIGTWPIELGQQVRVRTPTGEVSATWRENLGPNSYWEANLGPLTAGTHELLIRGSAPRGEAAPVSVRLEVGPRLQVALLWHMHQPLYRVRTGFYEAPWVRLHALRDYYAMGALLLERPGMRAAVDLTPVLLQQIEDYADHGATDELLELTLAPAESLGPAQAERLCLLGFDLSWHGQVFPHPRFRGLFLLRASGARLETQDLRDLQVWASLAWFDPSFLRGPVALASGEMVDVSALAARDAGYTHEDVLVVVDAQRAVMRAIVPLYRELEARGQVELVSCPAFHPILPLLIDTDDAVLDRPGTCLPRRFAHPEDALAHVRMALESHKASFGRPPSGMWPAEGAVSEAVSTLLARLGVAWMATDQGVLARSGRWGYDAAEPEVRCRARRAESGLAVLFRDTALSDAIGFEYGRWPPGRAAVDDLVACLRERASQLGPDGRRLLLVVIDGENPWGGYPELGRPFLRELYRQLAESPEIAPTTPSAWLAEAGPLPELGPLATGSWIDEHGSAPGVDLGTWIGEPEEDRAWELLCDLRAALSPEVPAAAQEALYAAEGSDWTWWCGSDQDSGLDTFFDALFRAHLRRAWAGAGLAPPAELDLPIVEAPLVWTFGSPRRAFPSHARLAVRTNCAGRLRWRLDDGPETEARLRPVGGVMAGPHRFELLLGPFPPDARDLVFSFTCEDCRCAGGEPCCAAGEQRLEIILEKR